LIANKANNINKMHQYPNFNDHQFINYEDPSKLYNWRTRVNPVFRLLDDKRWLDNFFEKGELALSCLSNFKNYAEEYQGDKDEGIGLVWYNATNGDTNAVFYEAGLNAHVFCTTHEINEKIISDFNAVGCIKIHNPNYFALDIMRSLGNCTQGISGSCIYANSRAFNRDTPNMKEILKKGDHLNNSEFFEEFRTSTIEHELFLKLEKYKYQNEHRMLWFSDTQIKDTIVIKCPDAVKYCERIEFV
jgi:hypothetical protein